MVTSCTRVGVAVIRPIEPVDAIINIVARVGVDDINNHADAETVSFINEILEVIRISLPA